jgi:glutamyl-tRNA synthetase
LQGWSYDDHTEIMSRDEVIARFTIDRVQASPARWNPDKLKDMNGIYIRKLSSDEVAERILPFLVSAGLISGEDDADEHAYVRQLTPLIHERLEELSEAPELLEFFFREVSYPDVSLLIPKKMDAASTAAALRAAHDSLLAQEDWSAAALETRLRTLSEESGVKPGPLFGTIRVAVTGRSVAPPLFDTLAALGRDTSLQRIAAAIAALGYASHP